MKVVKKEREFRKEGKEGDRGTVRVSLLHYPASIPGQLSCARHHTKCWRFEGKYGTSPPSQLS